MTISYAKTELFEEMMKKVESQLIKKIRQKKISLSVLGSGYVGLPTAALFANAGFQVEAIDLKPNLIKTVKGGVSPIDEPGLNKLISKNVQAGRLKPVLNSAEALSQTDCVIISVQTPIDKHKRPNLSFLSKAVESVGQNLKREMIVVVSSTVPPGTMIKQVKPTLELLSGLKVNSEFYLAYVPERIAPGNALNEFVESPRLIGGVGENSTKITATLFKMVCKTVMETDAQTAEIAKLAENTFRDVNIAFANQLALICEEQGVDVCNAIQLANTHPRVNIHKPGPGVGGPCLPKDPYLLTNSYSGKDTNLITKARVVNDYMPKHVLKLIIRALTNICEKVEEGKIAILGSSYKGDVGDSRMSPAKPIIQELIPIGVEVVIYDPYCNENFKATNVQSLKEAVMNANAIVILTDHQSFKNLNLEEIKSWMKTPVIVDGRRIINPSNAKKAGFTYWGVGLKEPTV